MLPWLFAPIAIGLGITAAVIAVSKGRSSSSSSSSSSNRDEQIRRSKEREKNEKLSFYQNLISKKESALLSKYECHIKDSRKAPVVGRKKYEIAKIEKSLQILESMQQDICSKLEFANHRLSHKKL